MQIFVDQQHPWAQLSAENQTDVERLLDFTSSRVPTCKKPPLWIFDVDSTLLCLSERNRKIFQDYLRFEYRDGPMHKTLLQMSSQMSSANHNYGILTNLRYVAQENGVDFEEKFLDSFQDQFFPFWYQNFFSEKYLEYDFAYPGAADFCRKISDMGVHICYLTGRYANQMTSGTVRSMAKMSFPTYSDNAFWNLKLDPEEVDLSYKERYLRHLNCVYDVIGFMDNEPENVWAQHIINPNVANVWFHSISSDRLPKTMRNSLPIMAMSAFEL